MWRDDQLEFPGHRVKSSLEEDVVTLKEEVVWESQILGIGGHLNDSLGVAGLDQRLWSAE